MNQSPIAFVEEGNYFYQVTEEDLQNVLASNQLSASSVNGRTIDQLVKDYFPELDFQLIEEAALSGDSMDEQTDYATDEIAIQLRKIGVLV